MKAEKIWPNVRQTQQKSLEELVCRIREVGEQMVLIRLYNPTGLEHVLINRLVSAVRSERTKSYLEQLLTDEAKPIPLKGM